MEPVEWTDGAPRSGRFGDVYHSSSGALAQARHVFLAGCGLPEAWRGRRRWRILETGFGLGLNFLATWLAWRADPQRPDRLVFESIEGWPVAPADIRRAARADEELAALATELTEGLAASTGWSASRVSPARRVSLAFEDGRVRLVIHVARILELIRSPSWRADPTVADIDSIFLDGFSPARNPDIWSEAVLVALGARARPGTGVATWTVAAPVRRGLALAGFTVEKRPGLPPKRHCLAGRRG